MFMSWAFFFDGRFVRLWPLAASRFPVIPQELQAFGQSVSDVRIL